MKLLLVAGGGGHFAAALAVIQRLPKDWELLVIGRKYTFENDKTVSFEYQTAQKLGIPFQTITTGRLQRKASHRTLISLLKVPVGFSQALKIIHSFKPDVLLSFGGYVSLPVAYAARVRHIPIVVHEQILGAGLANKLVSQFAKKVCVSWVQSEKFFPREKVVLTGNPMRTRLPQVNNLLSEKPLLYVTGGSGGAHAINILIEGCLEKLLEDFTIIHQTGDAQEFGDYNRLATFRENLPAEKKQNYIVQKFIEPAEVFAILQRATLVVSRSGMNTVTELLSFNKPCLLIPLPYGQKNEQLENANFVKEIGLAEVAMQKGLTSEELYAMIMNMLEHITSYQSHEDAIKKLIMPNAAEKIMEVVADVFQETETAKAK